MKNYRMKLLLLTLAAMCLCAVQASALEYTYAGADDFLFGRPTSDDTIYEVENPNVDRSKNVALIAPGFGTPTSYLPGSGEYLTPNLVPGALNGGPGQTKGLPVSQRRRLPALSAHAGKPFMTGLVRSAPYI